MKFFKFSDMMPVSFVNDFAFSPGGKTGAATALGRFWSRRIFPGFRIGEGVIWLLFFISWPAMLASINFIEGKYSDPGFMSFGMFIRVQAIVLSCKAVCFALFWWLYFRKLSRMSVAKKLALHFLTAPLYAALCIGLMYLGISQLLKLPYVRGTILFDFYNLLLIYTLHFTLFHAYNFWISEFRQRLQEKELRNLAYVTEIKALKAQIEPHFLFNTLNSISASVPPENEKTRVMIAELADTFRFALRASETEFITMREELQFIKTWLSLEKYRLKEKLQIEYDIDSRCLDIPIPPMLLQPIIENALNHGIAPKLNGGSVRISCQMEGRHVKVAISDSGVGYNGELQELLTKGIGLKNIAKRLELQYGQGIHVKRNESGLSFSFNLPLSGGRKLHETH